MTSKKRAEIIVATLRQNPTSDDFLTNAITSAIIEAVNAAREACAKIAEGPCQYTDDMKARHLTVNQAIAEAIRKPSI